MAELTLCYLRSAPQLPLPSKCLDIQTFTSKTSTPVDSHRLLRKLGQADHNPERTSTCPRSISMPVSQQNSINYGSLNFQDNHCISQNRRDAYPLPSGKAVGSKAGSLRRARYTRKNEKCIPPQTPALLTYLEGLVQHTQAQSYSRLPWPLFLSPTCRAAERLGVVV